MSIAGLLVAIKRTRYAQLLADDEAAWKQANSFAGDVMKDIDGMFRPGQEWSVEVTDEQKRMLYRIEIGSWKTN